MHACNHRGSVDKPHSRGLKGAEADAASGRAPALLANTVGRLFLRVVLYKKSKILAPNFTFSAY